MSDGMLIKGKKWAIIERTGSGLTILPLRARRFADVSVGMRIDFDGAVYRIDRIERARVYLVSDGGANG